jgi:hypothetical protein
MGATERPASLVKLVHVADLRTWACLKRYEDHDGITLADYRRRKSAAEAMSQEVAGLAAAEARLTEIDHGAPFVYRKEYIEVPRRLVPRHLRFNLPVPAHEGTEFDSDEGTVVDGQLRIRASWRRRWTFVRYTCPSQVHYRAEIVKLRNTLETASAIDRWKLNEVRTTRDLHKVIFISHRWDGADHPDPEGRQLARLSVLENCYVIYDYCAFPQDTSTPEGAAALNTVLSGMNEFIHDVAVLAAPDYLERGWCIYEYIVASMRASLVCDEMNDPTFVTLRNLAATRPPVSPRLSGEGMESEIQNAKNNRTLETVNALLPSFGGSKFSVESDRVIVKDLLILELMRMLPSKLEHTPYLGWTPTRWTKDELLNAFSSKLEWERMQDSLYFKPYEMEVPETLEAAKARGYEVDRMPFDRTEMAWMRLVDGKGFGMLIGGFAWALLYIAAAAIGAAALVTLLLFFLVRWIFFS